MGQKNVTIASGMTVAGIPYNASLALSGNDEFSNSYSVPAAQSGVLTVRTDNNTGSLTMDSVDHGIITGARLDLYWVGGTRRGVVVGTVAGTVVPIDLGAGDNLPIATTVVIGSVPVVGSFPATVADLLVVAAQCDFESQFTFTEAAGATEDLTFHIVPAAANTLTSDFWALGLGGVDPTGTAMTQVYMSHADPAAAHIMTPAYMSN
jgi:hypothetical protein